MVSRLTPPVGIVNWTLSVGTGANENGAAPVQLALSLSKGASRSRTSVVFLLVWFDKLTTNGKEVDNPVKRQLS